MSVKPQEFLKRLGATVTSEVLAVAVAYLLVQGILWVVNSFFSVNGPAYGWRIYGFIILGAVSVTGFLGFIATYVIGRILFDRIMFDETNFKRVLFDVTACLVVSSLVLAALRDANAPMIQSLAF